MKIEGSISVKFRAFGITIGTLTKKFSERVPDVDAQLVRINERGVQLTINAKKEASSNAA